MKILEDYKKIAKELLIEADEQQPLDDKEKEKAKSQGLVYKGFGNWGKDKEGPTTHKNVDGKLVQVDKDKDDEKPSGQKLGGSDFDRDDTFGAPGSEVDKYLKSLRGKPGYDDEDDEGDIDIAKGKNYGGRGFGDDDRDAQNQKDADDWASKAFGAEKDKVTGKGDDAEPKSDDTPKDKSKEDNMKGVPSRFPEFELAEEPFEYDDYDEDMENEIADEVVAYFVDNADKEAMKDYTEEEMMDFVQAQSEKLVAKYQQPDGVPNEKRSMLAYRNDLIDNVRFELGYADGEAGFDADDGPKESVQPKKKPFLKEQLERIGGLK